MINKELAYKGEHWTAYWTDSHSSPLVLLPVEKDVDPRCLSTEQTQEIVKVAHKAFATIGEEFIDYRVSSFMGHFFVYPVVAHMETLHWDITVYLGEVAVEAACDFEWDIGIPPETKEELDVALAECNPHDLPVGMVLNFLKTGARANGLH